MGTNYYRRRKINEHQRHLLHDALDQFVNHTMSEDNFIDLLKDANEEIHLCKISCGWQALFDHNWGKYFDLTEESLVNFITDPDTYIVDEYNKEYTGEEFLDLVRTHNTDTHNTFTPQSYREYEDNTGRYDDSSELTTSYYLNQCKSDLGIDTHGKLEIPVGQYVFSIFSDFC